MDKRNLSSSETLDKSDQSKRDMALILDTMQSLGVTPETLRETSEAEPHVCTLSDEDEDLRDEEWALIAPLLPTEPPQAKAMGNRQFLNAVLKAHNRGRWTVRLKNGPLSDAVRRRFGRWAHQGIWQKVAQELEESQLSEQRKSTFRDLARRSKNLCP